MQDVVYQAVLLEKDTICENQRKLDVQIAKCICPNYKMFVVCPRKVESEGGGSCEVVVRLQAFAYFFSSSSSVRSTSVSILQYSKSSRIPEYQVVFETILQGMSDATQSQLFSKRYSLLNI